MTSKAWIVVRHEFLTTVRRKGWLIATFGMPLFLVLYGGIASIAPLLMARKSVQPRTVGLVDFASVVKMPEGGKLDVSLPEEARRALEMLPQSHSGAGLVKSMTGKIEVRSYADELAGKKALDAKGISTLFVIPSDYLERGKVFRYSAEESLLSEAINEREKKAVESLLITSLLQGKLDPKVQNRVLEPLSVESYSRQSDGSYRKRSLLVVASSFGIPVGFATLLFISLMMNATYLLQGVSEEKENRVIEVILSSVDARSLLVGKLLGLGAAGLLQLLIWLAMVVLPLLLVLAGIAFRPQVALVCLACFVLGFLLYGTLMTGTGAIGTNFRESQQYAMVWSLFSAVPMLFLPLIIDAPNGVAARVLSLMPLTAPVSLMLRVGAGAVPWWEVTLSLVLLAGSIWLALRLAVRVFRTAILLYGKRPGFFEVLRWLREAA
ncbi:MAG: hypothetical protein DMF49_08375 [Acidobacteria bacterium]|nr:MAG: hypothetical protein DMF49_08375 [Acidobacteriota bacterium]